MTTNRSRWRVAGVAAGLALVALWVLRGLLWSAADRLPGLDAPIYYSWEIYTRAVLSGGHLPFWDPYLLAGTPHLADVQMLVFYPPAILLRWLPAVSYLKWMVALHVWIGGLGGVWLARIIRLGWPASIVVALGLMLGGSLAPWLYQGHLLIIFSTAWAPWALGAAMLSVRRSTYLPHPVLVLVTVLQFLAGYPQGSLYTVAMIVAFYAYAFVWPDASAQTTRARVAAQLGGLAVLSAGLSAIQLLPFLRFGLEAARAAGRPYSFAVQDGWSFRDLGMVFFPFVGAASSGMPYRQMLDGVYVGWLAALFVPFAFAERQRRRVALFCAVLTAAAIAFALGDHLPFYRLHYLLFPGFRVPGRLLFIARLGLAVLAGTGLDAAIAIARRREWRPLAIGAAVAAVACVGAASIAWRPAVHGLAMTHGWPWLPLITAAAVLIAAAGPFGATSRSAALVVLVGLDLVVFSAGGVETVPVESPATIRQWLVVGGSGRVWSRCSAVSSTGLLLAHQPSIDGPEGLSLRNYSDWLDVLSATTRDDLAGPGRSMADLADVSLIVSCGRLAAHGLSLVNTAHGMLVYRNDTAASRAFWSCHPVTVPRREIIERMRSGRLDDAQSGVQFVSVRWARRIGDSERHALERRYHLSDGALREGTTWHYALGDASPANIRALINNPAVEDTSGVDRAAAAVRGDADARLAAIETVITRTGCPQSAVTTVTDSDRPDGHVSVEVIAPAAGVLLMNEPFFPERRAFVDGRPAPSTIANLAFTAVALPAGHHRVELRLVPDSFYWGTAITCVTGGAWGALLLIEWRSDRRRVAVATARAGTSA
jgi:hypothetical protein